MSEDIVIIQGKMAGSKNEAFVGQALDLAKIPYWYQYPIYGGTSAFGGLVVDFVAMIPWLQPIEVQGGIWHVGQLGMYDHLALNLEEEYFGRETIQFFEEESNTLEAAMRAVKSKIGRIM